MSNLDKVGEVQQEGIIRRFLRHLFGGPPQDRFLKLLIEQTEWAVEGVDGLLEYMSKQSKSHAKQVRAAEKEADEVRRIIIDELNRTFVTSIDREDIFALSRAIDDVVDYADTTVEEMEMLEVEANSYLRDMAALLRDAAHEIHLGVLRLEDHPNVAAEHAMRAKALENRVESLYREAIADLFQGPQDIGHVVEMLKLREIYRHLSNAADRGDEAANIIGDIVVKMM
jgi:predicted phosphate transport protein (TIGR00153 family)